MGKYRAFLNAVFIATHEYRLEFLANFLRSTFFFVFQVFLWKVIFENRTDFQGYKLNELLGYYLINIMISPLVHSHDSYKIMERIKDGRVANSIVRPYSYLKSMYAERLGGKMYALLFFILYLIIIQIFHPFGIYLRLANLGLFGISIVIGFTFNFLVQFLIGCITFWAQSIGGLITASDQILDFLRGNWLPLDILGSLGKILIIMPFKVVVFLPIGILLGRYSTSQIILQLIQGFIWVLILILIKQIVWKVGLKKFEAVGT